MLGTWAVKLLWKYIGELAQTGERSLCMREAPGSIPGFSTYMVVGRKTNDKYDRWG